ncbi:MAG: hypothetical protein L6V93_11290 [Clostridiales bacterium]|nr:MAG: hypothetical protein L6V93_11290 [Clostridiales bacterium]
MDKVIGRENEIERVIQIFKPPHEKQPGSPRRTGCRQNGYCGGNCAENC